MPSFGTLLAVNAGQAGPMKVQGETIVTGFDKRPTRSVGRIDAGGLVGDDHVDDINDPDRAVLVYQRAHYAAWVEELGRDLLPGTFGEQLTIDGPLETEIFIGDRLRVGSVLLEVTQPRIPCRKMAVRLGAEDMPMRYLRSGRVGFFCKVLKTGHVRAGDRIERLQLGPDGLSVAELATVLHRDEPDARQVEKVLSSSVLPKSIHTKLAKLVAGMATQPQAWSGDRPLLVSARTRHGAGVISLDLVDPYGERLPDFEAGQFLTLTLDVPGVERPVVRTYTIAGRSADNLGYRLAVKREQPPLGAVDIPPGLASGHLHDTAMVGTTLLARAPRGRFVLQRNDGPVVLISAGIGITPMLAMLEELATNETIEPGREVFFVHAARSSRELAFGAHARALVDSSPRLRSHLLFSQPHPDDLPGRDFDTAGRLTPQTLHQILPSLEADFYVCGPAPFMADIVSGLLESGVQENRVHHEFFGIARSLLGEGDGEGDGTEALDSDGRPIVVTFARSGITVPWRENTFSLLALAEQSGLSPDASCRTGLCNTCVARIDDGEIDYVIEPMDAVTPGKVAVCCARPRTSVMIDL